MNLAIDRFPPKPCPKLMSIHLLLGLIMLFTLSGRAQEFEDFTAVRAEVDFSDKLRVWDGFGFNYVETAQTMDYAKDPQEYGGFSLLDPSEKEEIIDMVFGADGLRVSLIKMFLDPWHQTGPGAEFDHRTTTKTMREFVRMGLNTTRERGEDLQIITTLYGPPAWATQQKILRGRDIDPKMKGAVADYMVDWIRFLDEEEKFPIKYISLHNEGEDWYRWPADGKDGNIGHGHDYNMHWPGELVAEFIPLMRSKLDARGLTQVGVTNGEPTNWYRFSTWGQADALARDRDALNNLGIITSHGFYSGGYRNRWFGPHTSEGIDKLRALRPELKAWVTSTSWSAMDAKNIKEMHGNIYTSKVNAIIPWAGIQRPPQWVGGDPNPGSAFTISENGDYTVRRGYYFYKQVTRAGRPGMAVTNTISNDSQVAIMAFAHNGTANPDAIVITNWGDDDKQVDLTVKWSSSNSFEAFRTTEGDKDANGKSKDNGEKYNYLGDYETADGKLLLSLPKGSVTTLFAK